MHDDEPLYEGLRPGVLFAARYELLRVLGQGGFGRVFLAQDQTLDTRIALKVLSPALAEEEGHLKRFRREVLLARKISHRNVCKLFDVGQAAGLVYLTMEYIDGPSLHSLLRSRGPFPVSGGLDVCRQVAAALEAAHNEGVVHRDLKPHNILIDQSGTAKILDFGVARSVDWSGITATGAMIGTPAYMSPEQCLGERGDFRSDLYSFGVLMYQFFTGEPPFSADTPLGLLFLHVQQPPPSPLELNPGLPPELGSVILKCLAKHPSERYQSAGEVLAALQACPSPQVQSPQALAPPEADTLGSELTTRHLGGLDVPAGMTPPTRELPEAGPATDVVLQAWAPDRPTPVSTGPVAQAVPQPEVPARQSGARAPGVDDRAPTPSAKASEPSSARRTGLGLAAAIAGLVLAAGAAGLWQGSSTGPGDPSQSTPVASPEPAANLLVPLPQPPTATATAPPAHTPAELTRSLNATETAATLPRATSIVPATSNAASLVPQTAATATVPAPLIAASPVPDSSTATSTVPATSTKPATSTATGIVSGTPTETSTVAATSTPAKMDTSTPTETGTPALKPTASRSPSPTVPPMKPAQRPSTSSPRPAVRRRPSQSLQRQPTSVPSPQWVEDLILGGAPEGTEICIDGRPATRLGLSFVLDPVPAGQHILRLVSRERGFAELVFSALGGGAHNPPIKISDSQWDPPRYTAVLRAPDGQLIELKRELGVEEQIRLDSGEVLRIQATVQDQTFRLRRADGRTVEKPCSRKPEPACNPLALLECGPVTLAP